MKEFIKFKSNMHSFLVHDSNENKKAKGVNKNLVATMSK